MRSAKSRRAPRSAMCESAVHSHSHSNQAARFYIIPYSRRKSAHAKTPASAI